MLANYHMHTWRCNHATGTEREYIEQAIDHYQIIGFSDHTPQPFKNGFVDKDKMRMDQLEDYVTTILKLKEEYKDQIEIHIGLEVEYYPALFQELMDYVAKFPIEYMILGQHWLGNRVNEPSSFAPTEDPAILEKYVRQCIEAMHKGKFLYFAHPDVINFIGNDEVYDYWMQKLCQAANEKKVPLEINFLGIRGNRNYPNEKFWKIAGEEKCKVIFGADAHRKEDVWDPAKKKKGEELVRKYHLQKINELEVLHTSQTLK